MTNSHDSIVDPVPSPTFCCSFFFFINFLLVVLYIFNNLCALTQSATAMGRSVLNYLALMTMVK